METKDLLGDFMCSSFFCLLREMINYHDDGGVPTFERHFSSIS